jgi:hypothetical protein
MNNDRVYTTCYFSEMPRRCDITSQQLMDGSVVILNGNRVQVSLTS